MNRQDRQTVWHRMPMSLLISVLFILGAYRIAVTPDGVDGFAMITVAILLVGVWLTVELHDKFYGEHQHIRETVREELSEEDR